MSAYEIYRAVQDAKDQAMWVIQKKRFGYWTGERVVYGTQADAQRVLDAMVAPKIIYPSSAFNGADKP